MADERTIFNEALARPAGPQRAGYLDAACAGDKALRTRVDALLAAHAAAGQFLESPPPGLTTSSEDTAGNPSRGGERPGAMVGPYKLLEQLGEGGIGVVFMAEQLTPVRRKVALKIIKPGLDTRQVIARFEAERQALALMDHPNIAQVLDAGATDAGRPYFVMELVKGVPITDYCDQNRLSPRQRLELFITVCQAVQHAHQKGIIHRDLKPSNVLVSVADDGRPVPKVIDFGIAKATAGQSLTERTLFTEFRQLVGTPLYMSPEQAEPSALLDVDTRSDVYSLGVVLHELLTGTTPFDKRRMAKAVYEEVCRIIREEEPPRPSTRLSTLGDTLTDISARRHSNPKRLSQTIRGELDWIVMKALEKDRGRRYETASGFARDIERYLANQPVEACPPSRAYRLRKLVRRNKAAITTTAVIAVVLILGTAVSTWQAVRATRATAAARAAEQRVSHERDQALAEKRRADEQTQIAREVNQFFCTDVLGQASTWNQPADSGVQHDANIRLRDALDRAAKAVPNGFQDRPLVKAAICQAIGETYFGIPDYAALRLRQQFAGPEARETLQSMTFLARAYMGTWDRSKLTPLDRGRQKALALARQSYETQRRLFGDDDPQTVEATWCLATIYLHTGQFEQCRPLLLHLLEYHKRADGPDALNTTVAIGQMGRFYALQHNYREAEPWLRDLLQWHLAHAGPLNQGTIGAMEDLGSIYLHEGRYWEAEALWSQGLACARRVFGADDFWTADAERNLKFAYSEHQRHPEAGPMFLGGMDGFERFESKLNSILSPARPAAATRPAASPATAPATAARQP